MANNDTSVAIIGGGAAGIAAGRRLHDAGIDCLIIEARERLGGRAFTETNAGFPIDHGCGWLHSADRNPWVTIAQAQGRTVDKTPPPWSQYPIGFESDELRDYRAAFHRFYERVADLADAQNDTPVAAALDRNGRWNGLIGAVTTFISGAEPEKISARDFGNYTDSDVNWRVVEGYGATVSAHGGGVPAIFGCAVRRIDQSRKRLAIDTALGTILADRAIVTLPTSVLAEAEGLFAPALPAKTQAAHDLPLGFADKLFIAVANPDEFERDSNLFGAKDLTSTAAYHLRPFGRPLIEAYFGGTLARDLEKDGETAFFDFAISQLRDKLGCSAARLKPIHIHRWGLDRFARGAYSYAVPGKADARAVLAAPIDGRLFFAGEACSQDDYSTAHGAHRTGVAVAEHIIKMGAR